MKKLLLALIILLIGIGLAFSQSITVTSPHSGDTWYKGHSYNITWNHSGTINANVKIRLYQGDTRVLAIIDSTPTADHSFPWPIPGFLDEGTYKIRIKTVDNLYSDESEPFTISNEPSAPAASITVTSPHSGDTWYKSHSYNITWNKSGTMSDHVKIRLYKGFDKVLDIVDSADNNGSFPWPIPDTLDEGTYKVRIKTTDNAVYDDSDEFTINNGLILPGRVDVIRDFEIKNIYFVYNRGGYLVARIKNRIYNFSGNLKFRVNFVDDPLPLGTSMDYTKHINMSAGQEANVYLTPSTSIPGRISFCGKRVRVTIDPDNSIWETNERNNSLLKRIYITRADLRIMAPRRELEIKKAYMISSYRWRIKFKIHVYASLTGVSSLNNVRVRWFIKHAGAVDDAELYSHSFDRFTINNREEKIFSVDNKFGSPDKSRSIRPRLSEGNYSIVVVVSTRDRLCDPTHNNRFQFSFRLH